MSGEETVDTGNGVQPTGSFWIISVLALLWNLLGLMAFFGQVAVMNSEEALNQLPEAERELYKNLPNWVMVCFGIAVVCGVLGCVLLLMRNKLALPVFGLSLLGVIGQQIHNYFLSNTVDVMGTGAIAFPMIVLVIAIALMFFAKSKTSIGILK